MIYVLKCNNGIVTDWYMETIGCVISELGYDIIYTNRIEEIYSNSKNTVVVVANLLDALRLWIRGYRNLIMWFQGIEPEESYMRNHSRIRMYILSCMEKFLLERVHFSLFVSNAMRKHFEVKYGITLDTNRYYCMPCQNTKIHREAFFEPTKYKNNCFAYVGSLAVWQKFEDTLDCYIKLEKLGLNNTSLLVLTPDGEQALNILKRKGVKNFEIDFVSNDELPSILKRVKYGFILREDTPVNRVATPTKISTYLSCGIIPIYSECLESFFEIAKKTNYTLRYSQNLEKDIIELNQHEISNEDIFREYNNVFYTYYNNDIHKKNIKSLLKNILKR